MDFVLQPRQFYLVILAGWINRQQQEVIDYLLTENQVLKEKVGTKRILLNDEQRRRLAVKGKILGCKRLEEVGTLFTPDTILRWHRMLVAKKWDYSKNRNSVGRPRIRQVIVDLILRFAKENPAWGYDRIQGALANVGYHISDTTVEVWAKGGLLTFYLLFVMELKTRRVHFAGCTTNPDDTWMKQVACELTNCEDGFLLGKTVVLMDRDAKCSQAFRDFLANEGAKPLRLPPRSPNLNAHLERVFGSLRPECLNRMIFFGSFQCSKTAVPPATMMPKVIRSSAMAMPTRYMTSAAA